MQLAKCVLCLLGYALLGVSFAGTLTGTPLPPAASAPAPSYVPNWPYDRCANGNLSGEVTANAKERIVSQFNNMVATHQIGVSTPSGFRTRFPAPNDLLTVSSCDDCAQVTYQFNKSQHFIVEGAQRLLAAGATTFKFSMTKKELEKLGITQATRFPSFLAFVTDPWLPWLQVLDMPFSTFQFWYEKGWVDRTRNATKVLDPYQQTYDVATYLLKRYNGTGKTFMFGEWKCDTQLWWPPANAGIAKPKFPYLKQPLNTATLEAIINIFSTQQKAVEDAKKDLAGRIQNVFAWFYAEVNMLPNASYVTCLTHAIPKIKPAVDYISYSLSTSPELIDSIPLMADRMSSALTIVNSFISPKPSVPGVRTFIGEFEYPLINWDGSPSLPTNTEALQARYALWQVASTIAWGSPYNMWWTFYDNTLVTNISTPRPRGFHLVTPEDKETILFKALQEYWKAATGYVAGWVDAKGHAPGDFAFRKWAVDKLVALSGVTDVPKPTVKSHGC